MPDFFVRTGRGVGVVIDVRPDGLIDSCDREKFEMTATVCDAAGWSYRRVGELPVAWMANVRWLAGYRHGRVVHGEVAARVRDRLRGGLRESLGGLADVMGDRVLVLPTLYHLLWSRELVTELSAQRLSLRTQVALAAPS